MILAMLDWIKPEQDSGGDYIPDPTAAREAHLVYEHSLRGKGQVGLFDDGGSHGSDE